MTEARYKDLTGQNFDRLTVIERAPNDSTGRAQWWCRCACGTERIAKSSSLTRGDTRSCGCLGLETRRANGLRCGQAQRHPNSKSSHPREYSSWQAMLDRCTNPQSAAYPNYGGRGITICDEWRVFARFLADMGSRPDLMATLERADNNEPYCRANCRWASRLEQANNRRNSRHLTANGETLTLAQWSRRLGCSWHTINARLARGWSVERAVSHPVVHGDQR